MPAQGDWLYGMSGVKCGEADELTALLGEEIQLPIYQKSEGNGGKVEYHWKITGKFKIIGFELASANNQPKEPGGVTRPDSPDNKYLMVQYIGPGSLGTAVSCASVTQ